jgi:hypothetical protein
MTRKHLLVAFLAALVGGLLGSLSFFPRAEAADPTPADKDTRLITNFRRGIRIGSAATSAAMLTRITYGTLDYDFPSLNGSNVANGTPCAVSNAVTVTGARFSDSCVVGIDQAPVSTNGQFTAYVSAADTAKVIACAPGITDGGSFNQPDSGFTVRCTGG